MKKENIMDKERFSEICLAHRDEIRERIGIGTLGEKTVHAVLKDYFEADRCFQEVKIGGYVADVAREGEIYEIQTKGFYRLVPKISTFLVENCVTVVYPIVVSKQLFWVDTETGECQSVRKSSRYGRAVQLFFELYALRDFLEHPHFRVCVMLLHANEYRALDGYGKDKKKRATKLDRIPTECIDEFYLETPHDYCRFLPDELPPRFTSADFRLIHKCNLKTAQRALNLLTKMELIRPVGKRERFVEYERT